MLSPPNELGLFDMGDGSIEFVTRSLAPGKNPVVDRWSREYDGEAILMGFGDYAYSTNPDRDRLQELIVAAAGDDGTDEVSGVRFVLERSAPPRDPLDHPM